MVAHVTAPATAELTRLPPWATLLRAPNPGPMTLDGTNTWVLRAPGAAAAVVVDPGPADEGHLAAVAAHGPIEAILVTHGHADHVDGIERLAELLGGVPVLSDGAGWNGAEWNAAGADGAEVGGATGLSIRPLSTPGHTSDSVSFLVTLPEAQRDITQRDERAVLTGDTILGRGTTVVAWPDGNLGQYLATLDALTRLGPVPVLPGHGPPLADCGAAAAFYLRHRLARLEEVRAARAAGVHDPAAMVRRVYADVDPALWPAAESSMRAQVEYLDQEQYSWPVRAVLDRAGTEPSEVPP